MNVELRVPSVPPIPRLKLKQRPGRHLRVSSAPTTSSARRAASSKSPRMSPIASGRAGFFTERFVWPESAYTTYSLPEEDAKLAGGAAVPTPRRPPVPSPRVPEHPLKASAGLVPSVAPAATGTQLEDRQPHLDTPQRVAAPAYLRGPKRRSRPKVTPAAESSSPTRLAARARTRHDLAAYLPASRAGVATPLPSTAAAPPSSSRDKRATRLSNQLKDSDMLAFAARRSGRMDQEVTAHFAVAVLRDNLQQYGAAIAAYRRFIDVCRDGGDTVGVAVGLNCAGVNYHLLAAAERDPDRAQKLYGRALDYHTHHLHATDPAGRFVAHTNIGLALSALGRHAESAKAHQQALQTAIQLMSPFGQSIAVGNLGIVSAMAGDFKTAIACMDQHLLLVRGLSDKRAESRAYQRMGQMAQAAADFGKASRCFQMAHDVAAKSGSRSTAASANCSLGVAVGNAKMDDMIDNLLSKASVPTRVRSHRALDTGMPKDRGGDGDAGAGAGAGATSSTSSTLPLLPRAGPPAVLSLSSAAVGSDPPGVTSGVAPTPIALDDAGGTE